MTALNSGARPTVLDVRSRWEFARGHVPGAVHIPFWTLPMRVSELSQSRDLPVVVYCGHGPRAWFAGAVLRANGFRQVVYLEGHMSKWKRAGLPQQSRSYDSGVRGQRSAERAVSGIRKQEQVVRRPEL